MTLDMFWIAVDETNVADQRALLERDRGPLHFQVLDDEHAVARDQGRAIGIPRRCTRRGFSRNGRPFMPTRSWRYSTPPGLSSRTALRVRSALEPAGKNACIRAVSAPYMNR